jgi:hypothetical protein
MNEFKDELMGHVEWTKNRYVLVFRRMYGDRTYIRMRVFNRHRQYGHFYPAPRSFHVGLDCARELGMTIASAAEGRPSMPPPAWWAEFTKQYERQGKLARPKCKRPTPDAETSKQPRK